MTEAEQLSAWDAECVRVARGGYVEPIPAPPDFWVWWPGKDEGKPKPPIIWGAAPVKTDR
jgi:hypothetical protein